MDALILRQAQVSEPGVAALISRHFALMRTSSPEDSCHVMRAEALADEQALVLAAESDGRILGVGALKVVGPGHGEIKSMHTCDAVRGKGIARRVLHGLVGKARTLGLNRLSLETGSSAMFAPARALYVSEGFRDCPPFGDYCDDPLSVFMTCSV